MLSCRCPARRTLIKRAMTAPATLPTPHASRLVPPITQAAVASNSAYVAGGRKTERGRELRIQPGNHATTIRPLLMANLPPA